MKNSQDGFASIVILLVLVIGLVGAGSYYVFTKSSSLNDAENTSFDENATPEESSTVANGIFSVDVPEGVSTIECEADGLSMVVASSDASDVANCDQDRYTTTTEVTTYTIGCGSLDDAPSERLQSDDKITYGDTTFDYYPSSANDGSTKRVLHNFTMQDDAKNVVCFMSLNYRAPTAQFNNDNLDFSKGLFSEFDQLAESFRLI